MNFWAKTQLYLNASVAPRVHKQPFANAYASNLKVITKLMFACFFLLPSSCQRMSYCRLEGALWRRLVNKPSF